LMNTQERAARLLAEWLQCRDARPKANNVNIQLEKDSCHQWAQHLTRQYHWGSDEEIAEACNQLESRLEPLKKKVIFEILKHGSL